MPEYSARGLAGWLMLIGWLAATAGLWMRFGAWAGLLMLGVLLFLYGIGMYQIAKQKQAFDRHVERAKARRETPQGRSWN